MGRFLPKSLLGQTLLAIGAALLVTQMVSGVLLYRAAENRMETSILNRVALNLIVDPANRDARVSRRLERQLGVSQPLFGPGGRLRSVTSPIAPLLPGERPMEGRAAMLGDILSSQGIEPVAIQVIERRAGDDPIAIARVQRNPRLSTRPKWADQRMVVAGIQLQTGGPWRIARALLPEDRPRPLAGILLQTIVLFVVLMGVLFLILRRITRPLARLTERVGDFASNPDRAVVIEESGPADMRRLIAAHNRMETRIAALLDEKDVMLGAIGHDLKTPLAALRVRIESVPDETQRARMAASIEDITRTLDDILSLARVGRSGGPAEVVNLGALAMGIVEEFEDLGEPVTITDTPRLAARVQETWLKRAVRNLVSNAVRYGGSAELKVFKAADEAVIRVEDNGPGIPADQIETMLEPFTRGEASRNRATGGAGLGLTLARAIAEQHGGTLTLTNREEGGLRAEIRLPLG